MKFNISYKGKLQEELSYLFSFFPSELTKKINEVLFKNQYKRINEIRIKKNSLLHLIADSKSVVTDIYISEETVEEIFLSLCRGSIYAHADTIKEGYISLGRGIRAGICGTAVTENNVLVGVRDVSSINIRIPQIIPWASNYVYSLLEKSNFSASILIFSPPGAGKTTILRDLVNKLGAKSNKRYAVIDTRDEILISETKNSHCDAYISYPKGYAIELATKSMTPEIILCDEISNENEANAILKASNSGVVLIATTHASSYDELISKKILKSIFDAKIFKYFVGVNRKNGEKKYNFTLNEEKYEALLWKF